LSKLFGIFLVLSLSFTASICRADTGNIVEDTNARLDVLFAELKASDTEDFYEIEREIIDIWTHSGSAAMDMLLERGQQAIAEQDYPKAIEHLSALIDHAPDFAEAWNARATAYYFIDEYALSISDIRQALILNPRHFGALNGLGLIFEELGNPDLALTAYLMVQEIHPYIENVNAATEALSLEVDGVEL